MKTIRTIHTALDSDGASLYLLQLAPQDSADLIQGDSGGDNPGYKVTVHMTLSTAPSSENQSYVVMEMA